MQKLESGSILGAKNTNRIRKIFGTLWNM